MSDATQQIESGVATAEPAAMTPGRQAVSVGMKDFPFVRPKNSKGQPLVRRGPANTADESRSVMVAARTPTRLASIIAPVSPSEFRSRYYAKEALYVGQSPEKFKDLFDLESLRRILNSSPILPPTLALSTAERGGLFVSDAAAVMRNVREGATMIFEELDKYDSRVGLLTAELGAELGERAKVNMYFSQPGRPAFNRHYDVYDGYVVQLSGFKRWRVSYPTVKNPSQVQKHHVTMISPDVAPYLDCTLVPGDVLYVPRGHWHEATAQVEPSLHLTIVTYPRTGVDFLAWLADELREDARWRASLPLTFPDDLPPGGGESPAVVEHYQTLRQLLGEALNDNEILAKYRRFCIARDKPMTQFPVPFDNPSPVFQEDDEFDRPGYQRAELAANGDTTNLVVWGRLFTFTSTAEPLLKFILSRERFSLRDVLAHGESLSAEDVQAVLRLLVDQGIVQPR